jgi:WD40 repeat protein
VRYFQNPETKNDYFISADKKYNIIVWDLSNNCDKKLEMEVKYEGFIYSCLLIFEEKKMFAVTSSLGSNSITRVIDVDNKSNVTEITDSKDLNVYFLAHWINRNAASDKQKHVIIQCAKNKILFSEFPQNSTYHKIETDEKHPYIQAGIVFKNQGKDMFACSATYGLVLVVDLETKTKVKEILMDDVHLYSFVRWNDHYLLLNDCLQRRVIVFDMLNDYKIKSKVLCPEMYFERFIKKFYWGFSQRKWNNKTC